MSGLEDNTERADDERGEVEVHSTYPSGLDGSNRGSRTEAPVEFVAANPAGCASPAVSVLDNVSFFDGSANNFRLSAISLQGSENLQHQHNNNNENKENELQLAPIAAAAVDIPAIFGQKRARDDTINSTNDVADLAMQHGSHSTFSSLSAVELLNFCVGKSGVMSTPDFFGFSFSGLDYALVLSSIMPQAVELSALCWSSLPIEAQIEANLACFLSCAAFAASTAALQLPLSQDGSTLRPHHLAPESAKVADHIRVQMWLYKLSGLLGTTNSPTESRSLRAQLREQYAQTAPTQPRLRSKAYSISSSVIAFQSHLASAPALVPLHTLLVDASDAAIAQALSKREKDELLATAAVATKAAKASAEAAALQSAANSTSASKFKGVPACATRVPNRLATPPPPTASKNKQTIKVPSEVASAAPLPMSYFDHSNVEQQLRSLAEASVDMYLLQAQLEGAATVFDSQPTDPDFAMLLVSLTKLVPLSPA